ncbi:MAG: sulfatase-like hydrolase/transferase, partial [Planctomycetes bacterium]|nr:sulfatase-like hydrolase/transferase [Planctomycetota bacterium]
METWNRNIRMLTAVLILIALVGSLPTQAIAKSTSTQPNIVLLFADDVGYGDLSCYGHPTIKTPSLDKLAGEGLRLTSFYSATSCVPARTQLMLGRYLSRVNLGKTGAGGDGGIPDSEVTLAQALKKVGYRTAMMGKWHLGDSYPMRPMDQGFQYYLAHKGGGIGQPGDDFGNFMRGDSSYFDP